MKYCVKCGNPMEDDMMFCQKCGTKVDAYPPVNNSGNIYNASPAPATEATVTNKKRQVWLSILLWVCFLPIMAIIAIVKSKKMKKPVKAVLIILIVFISIGIAVSNQNASPSDSTNGSKIDSADSTSPSQNPAVSSDEKDETNSLFSDAISDEKLRLDFLNACEQIGMDPKKIKELKQVDDWVSGPRYSFTYLNMAFRLYANMDSSVNTIKLGADTDIFKQGFEPYQVSDYIVDTSIAAELRTMAEDYVKSQLNYPATADFSWLDWAYGRERELYSVSSQVTAKNAFGVEDELPFRLIYKVNDDTATLLYFELDGTVVLNNMDSVSTPERKKVETTDTSTKSEDGSIVLMEGQLGDYGQTITLDGSDYINYHIPQGTYIITNNGKWCKVYLAKDEYYKNSEGYMENEIVETIEFSNYGESKTITIGSGEHLELTINASVTLSLVEP